MVTKQLTVFCHTALSRDEKVQVSVTREALLLHVHFRWNGNLQNFRIPQPSAEKGFSNGLYQHTCFEVFAKGKSDQYLEWNFSPNEQWALFPFDEYRTRSAVEVAETAPSHFVESVSVGKNQLDLLVRLDLTQWQSFLNIRKQSTLQLAFCCVLEDLAGALSYWALAHPSENPDFHAPGSFLVML